MLFPEDFIHAAVQAAVVTVFSLVVSLSAGAGAFAIGRVCGCW